MRMTINLGRMQINQLGPNQQQLWTMPGPEVGPQYDLGNAVPGTPLPGQPTAPTSLSGVVPTSYPAYPQTPYPVTPAYAPPAPPGTTSDADVGPLPLYGQRLPATGTFRR
jgi:hypothetical protein